MKKVILIMVMVFLFGGCSYSNLDYVKDHAEQRWKQMGFEVIGYNGFQWGLTPLFPSYGGARVWYLLRCIPDNGLTYGGYLQRWGDEIHIYSLVAYDAIRPRN